MAIEELVDVVTPPASPREVGGLEERRQVEKSLGIELPNDYWDLATQYGSGQFVYQSGDVGLSITIWNPFSSTFRACVDDGCDTVRTLKKSEQVPFGIFPDKSGLLPIGSDDNGNSIFLLTKGELSSWPVVAWPHSGYSDDYEPFEMSLTSFLAKAFRGEFGLLLEMWNEPFFEDPNGTTFQPDS